MTRAAVNQFKGIAILMVFTIHTLAILPERNWSQPGLVPWILITTDQFCRLSVPLFIFLSWFGLTSKQTSSNIRWWRLLVTQAQKLVPLYLAWSLISLWLNAVIFNSTFAPQIPLSLKLLLGQADYHLYFVPLILIMYGILPFFVRFLRYNSLATTVITALITIGWIGYISQDTWIPPRLLEPDQFEYLVPLSWLWYALLGLLAHRYHLAAKLHHSLTRRLLLVLLIISFLATVVNGQLAIANHDSVLRALRFTRFSIVVFVTVAILFVLSICYHRKFTSHRWLEYLGTNSFLFYLVHTQVIRLIQLVWMKL